MKVYIEVVILDNLLMTAAISQMSYYVLGIKKTKIRTTVASVCGTIISVCYPLLPFPPLIIIVLKLSAGIGLSMILFIKKGKLFRGTLVFFLMTALAGGLCVLVNYTLICNLSVSVAAAPVLPYCLSSVIVCFAALIFKFLWEYSQKRRLKSSFEYVVRLSAFGQQFRLKGYLDSGNTLYDPNSGLPVVVVKLKAIQSKLDDNTIVLLLSGQANKIDGIRYLSTDSLAGNSRLALITPEKIELYSDNKMNTNINVMLGVSVKDFGGNADILLHPALNGGQ